MSCATHVLDEELQIHESEDQLAYRLIALPVKRHDTSFSAKEPYN